MDHSIMRFEVEKCSEASRIEGDPECSSDEEIEDWLHNKKLKMKFIDQKIMFSNFDDENNLMRTEKVDTVSLHSGFHAFD